MANLFSVVKLHNKDIILIPIGIVNSAPFAAKVAEPPPNRDTKALASAAIIKNHILVGSQVLCINKKFIHSIIIKILQRLNMTSKKLGRKLSKLRVVSIK